MADAPSAPSAGGTFKLMKMSLFVGCIALISLAEAEVDAKLTDDSNSLNADAATADEAEATTEAIQGKKNTPPEVPVFDLKPRRSSQMIFSQKDEEDGAETRRQAGADDATTPNAAAQEWHPPMSLWPALDAMDKTKETTRRALQHSNSIVDAVSKMNAEYSAQIMEDKAFSPAFKEQITEIINFYTPSRRTQEQLETAENGGLFYSEEDLMLWPNLIDEETNTVSSHRMLDQSNAIVDSVNALNSQLAHMAEFAYSHGYTGWAEEDQIHDGSSPRRLVSKTCHEGTLSIQLQEGQPSNNDYKTTLLDKYFKTICDFVTNNNVQKTNFVGSNVYKAFEHQEVDIKDLMLVVKRETRETDGGTVYDYFLSDRIKLVASVDIDNELYSLRFKTPEEAIYRIYYSPK